MRPVCFPILFAAACGTAAPTSDTTTPDNQTAAPDEPIAEVAEPDPSQYCDVFTTIRLDLAYDDAGCAGPASIELEYNPTATPELGPTDGDSELMTTSFDPQGCAIQGTWILTEAELVLDVHATGPNQLAGTATWTPGGDVLCPVRVTGSWETWASD
jgi:hypothetical protein